MSWQAYRLTYRAASPIALGAYRLGFIQRTRYYAPGWTLWGAITARLTRALLPRASSEDYRSVGAFVRDNLPTSYAYLVVRGCVPGEEALACPCYDGQGRLAYGPLSSAEFEARYLGSYGQTAIAADTMTAATNTLHETEFLSSHDRASGEAARWRFTLYARRPWRDLPGQLSGLGIDRVLAVLQGLTLGGDRGYGFGRLVRVEKAGPVSASGEERPRPLDWDGETLFAHASPDSRLPGDCVRGRLEPVARRLWRGEPGGQGGWGPGQEIRTHVLYAPGGRVTTDGWQPRIGPLGIWETEGGDGPA